MNYDWMDFSDEAKRAIRQTDLDTRGGFIKYLYEPSLGNPFCLNVAFDDQVCHWESIEWNRSADAQKFDIIEAIKYIGKKIEPTILIKSGRIPPDRCSPLLDKVRHIELPVLLDKDKWLIVDGETHTLIIGNSNWETSYRWTSLPYEWRALGEITREMASFA